MNGVLIIIASIALLLVAAKTHGRHVRLERELAGVWKVDFRSSNPPAVEAIWRKDRIVYWSVAAVIAILSVLYTLIAGASFLSRVREDLGVMGWGLIAIVWPMAIAFMTAGVASAIRTMSAFSDGVATMPANWKSEALNGSILWWILTALAQAAVCFLSSRR